MKRARIFIAALAAALASPAAAAPPSPLFASNAPLQIRIQAPLRQLIRDRSFQGSVAGSITDPSGAVLPASLALRGITRRTEEICDFPALKVKFSRPVPATSPFAGQDKLKLVTHCRSDARFQQKILLEYAAYRIFNVITERSMRARLATIVYVDSDGRPLFTRAGFFLESPSEVARRNDLSPVSAGPRIPLAWLNPDAAARYALFQEMIANHDWSMRAGPPGEDCCHNAELIGAGAPGKVIPVPYDFDFSGLVGAPYAFPPEALGISDVRQRKYRGYCIHSPNVVEAAAEFRSRRDAILGTLDEVPGLEADSRKRAARFLDRFFAEIATKDAVRNLVRGCIG